MINYKDTTRHSVIFQAQTDTPPTVFVDNNAGFIAYGPLPYGYKNTSLSYSNIHEAMGINFYATNESIGACIFKEGNMISITDSSIENFFTISPDHEVEISLVSVMQISSDIIYVSAIMNIGGGKIVFSSKTLSYEGLLLSIPTAIEHYTTTDSEKALHRTFFNIDGSLAMRPEEEVYFAYEEYGGSHGFGDLKIKEIYLDGGDSSSLITIMKEVQEDISSIVPAATRIPSDIYAIESFSSKGSLFIVALGIEKVTVISIVSEEKIMVDIIPFGKPNRQTKFDDVYSKKISYIPPSGLANASVYKRCYVPAGVVKRYGHISKIVFSRIEAVNIGGAEFKGLGMYEFRMKYNDNGETVIDFDEFFVDGEDAFPAGEVKFDVNDYNDLRYVFQSGGRTVNTHIGDTDVAARNKEVVHLSSAMGTLPNQKEDIISVKSASNFMMYGNLIEQ